MIYRSPTTSEIHIPLYLYISVDNHLFMIYMYITAITISMQNQISQCGLFMVYYLGDYIFRTLKL